MKTSTILKKALKLFRNGDGWTKRSFEGEPRKGRPGKKAYCAVGAICMATGSKWSSPASAKDALNRAIGGESIFSFNDAPERRFRDVARKFRKAIRIADRLGL